MYEDNCRPGCECEAEYFEETPATTVYVTLAWVDQERTDFGQVNVWSTRAQAEQWASPEGGAWGERIGPVDIREEKIVPPHPSQFMDLGGVTVRVGSEAETWEEYLEYVADEAANNPVTYHTGPGEDCDLCGGSCDSPF